MLTCSSKYTQGISGDLSTQKENIDAESKQYAKGRVCSGGDSKLLDANLFLVSGLKSLLVVVNELLPVCGQL